VREFRGKTSLINPNQVISAQIVDAKTCSECGNRLVVAFLVVESRNAGGKLTVASYSFGPEGFRGDGESLPHRYATLGCRQVSIASAGCRLEQQELPAG